MNQRQVDLLSKNIVTNGVVATAQELSDSQAIDLTESFGVRNDHPLPVNVVRASGSLVNVDFI